MKKSNKLFIAYGIIGAFALGGIIGTSISIAQQQKKLTLVQELDKYQLQKTSSLKQDVLASQYASNPLQKVTGEKWDSDDWSKELKIVELLTQKEVVNNDGKKPKIKFYLYDKSKPLAAIFDKDDYSLIKFKSYANDFEGVLYLEVTYPVTSAMKAQDASLQDSVTKVYTLSGFKKFPEFNSYQSNNTISISAKESDITHDFDSVAKFKASYDQMLADITKSSQASVDRETWFKKYFDFILAPVTAIDWDKVTLEFQNNTVQIHYTYGYQVLAASKNDLSKVRSFYPQNDAQGIQTFNNIFKAEEKNIA
ncbi:MAG1430 family protein [Mycoplasma sp. VS424B]|uniref:MAG1430 family protein n=1 Tax=Mycoplasma sp. VS424B TaxID=3401660 RepID=UPI003AAD5F80